MIRRWSAQKNAALTYSMKQNEIVLVNFFIFASPKIFLSMDAIKFVEEEFLGKEHGLPEFNPGDTITIYYRIKEGNKERIQPYKGTVLQVKGRGSNKTFTVRKISDGIGVERIFPFFSPSIERVEVNKKGKVRRAKLFYLRDAIGKKARIKEKR